MPRHGSEVVLDVDLASPSIRSWSDLFPFSANNAPQGQSHPFTTFDNFGITSALMDWTTPPNILPLTHQPHSSNLGLLPSEETYLFNASSFAGLQWGLGTSLPDDRRRLSPLLDLWPCDVDRYAFISSDSTVRPNLDGQGALSTTTVVDFETTNCLANLSDTPLVQGLTSGLEHFSSDMFDSHGSQGVSELFLKDTLESATYQQRLTYDTPSQKPIVAAVQNQTKSPAAEVSRKNPFTIIHEDGIRTVKETKPRAKRGVRRARLSAEDSVTIAMKRRTHEVCIRCKMARSGCAGGFPCKRCIAAWKRRPNIVQQPCLKAHFVDIVEAGSCNYVSQRITSHLTLDGASRRSVNIPAAFDFNSLLQSVQARQSLFNFRRRKMDEHLFVIDMAELSEVLKGISRHSTKRDVKTFREFIDSTLQDSPDWRGGVKECGGVDEPLALLGIWNNEPCRASYDIIPIGGEPRPLDIENKEDVEEIILAATLSRIICRKLELDGYRVLQKKINNMRFVSSENATQVVKLLGQLLTTLRWRLSWWDVYGDGRKDPDRERITYAKRVRHLTMVLYFYFFSIKRSISSWSNPSGMDGVWNEYADTLPMWDNFPTVESLEGMQNWLEKGKTLVTEAPNMRVPHMR